MGIETGLMAGASIVGGLLGNSASRQAASTQADAAQRGQDAQAAMYQQQRSDLQDWRTSGGLANNKLVSLMGLDGTDPTAALQSTPGYQFRLAEGQKQVDNSAAARGSTLSGATLKALQKYGQDYASNEYQNQYNRLSGMSTIGQNAAAGQGAAAQAFGNASASNTMQGANASSAGLVGGTNALTGGISNAINGWQQNQLMGLIGGKKWGNQDLADANGLTAMDIYRGF